MSAGEEFRQILKLRARGPEHLGFLEPELCERAMELILSGEATPAQIGGFLLVGRAVGDSAAELAAYAHPMRSFVRTIQATEGPPVVTVTGHPAELLLWALGRTAAAQVRFDGSEDAVRRLREARIGL